VLARSRIRRTLVACIASASLVAVKAFESRQFVVTIVPG
jgi:hypothetical protein